MLTTLLTYLLRAENARRRLFRLDVGRAPRPWHRGEESACVD